MPIQITINLIVQPLLLIAVCVAAIQAKKRRIAVHHRIINSAMVVELLAIALAMGPSLVVGFRARLGLPLLQAEVMAHATLAVLLILLWIYINLAVTRRVKMIFKTKTLMRTAFVTWIVVFLLGIHINIQIF